MRALVAVSLILLVTLVGLSGASGKKKRTELEFVFEDIVSPDTVAAAVRSRTRLEVPKDPAKGPVVLEPPPSTRIVTSPFNGALSAAVATVINSGKFDMIYNKGDNSLPRPDTSKCGTYPAAPAGVLQTVLNSGVLRVAYFEAPPMTSTGPRGATGYDVSLIQAVAAEIASHYHRPINVTFVPITVSASNFLGDVSAGLSTTYDVVLAVTDTAARRPTLQFSCPYNTADFQFVRGPLEPGLVFSTLESLNSASVSVATLPADNPVGAEARRRLPLANFVEGIRSSADVASTLASGSAHVGFDVGIAIRQYGYQVIDIPSKEFSPPALFALASAPLP